MRNKVTISLVFSFKGITHQPSLELDLDQYMQDNGKLPDLHMLIATANNFGLYSYEYEMIQAENITFTNPEGLVADYITDGILDTEAFEKAWQKNRLISELKMIAQQHIKTEILESNPDIMTALLAAYQQGKSDTEDAG